MPSSRPNTIPTVIHLLRQLRPKSILDVGVGFGKWGHLFREYTDVLEAEHDPARYRRRNWRVRIDGIEGHAAYLTPMHRYLYNTIHVGEAGELLRGLGRYDLIFLGDVIEHFTKAAGMRFLREALRKANRAVIVTTPKFDTGQDALCANELERHRSLWSAQDFARLPGARVKTIDRATLLAVIVKPGIPAPECEPAKPLTASVARRLRQCRGELTRLIPVGTPFILVDDEQLRGSLPHRRAIPFLERNGEYWGPPPDDATAIRELGRLRKSGARYLAIIWPSFWWLDHYAGFREHIRSRHPMVRDDKAVKVFDLSASLER